MTGGKPRYTGVLRRRLPNPEAEPLEWLLPRRLASRHLDGCLHRVLLAKPDVRVSPVSNRANKAPAAYVISGNRLHPQVPWCTLTTLLTNWTASECGPRGRPRPAAQPCTGAKPQCGRILARE